MRRPESIPSSIASFSRALMRRRTLNLLQLSAVAACALMASAPGRAAEPSALPAEHQSQGITYLSGGVDLGESTAIKAAMPRYPLVVEVFHSAGGKNEYTASSDITVLGPKGDTLLTTTLDGPFALLRLQPGRYDVKITYDGQTRQRKVDVPASGSTRATFVFGGA